MGNGLADALRDLSSRGRPYGPERVYRLAVEHGRRRDRRRRFGTAAVGAVAALVVFGLAIHARDEPPRQVTTGAPTTTAPLESLPLGFDVRTANPFFVGEGTADEVAVAYLRDRLHIVATTPSVERDVEATILSAIDDFATVRWSRSEPARGPDSGVRSRLLAAGLVYLRRDGGSWNVVAATTDDVNLSRLVYDGQRVHGVVFVTGTQLGGLSADVLDLSGKPVAAAPFPQGVPGAHYLYATAARGNGTELPIDVVVPNEPVLVRIHVVGGGWLSVSEVRFDPPQPSLPADGTARPQTPTVLASSDTAGRRWEFVSREDGFYGRCLEVRGPSGKVGGCGVSSPFAGYPAPLSGGLRVDDTFYAIFAGTVPSDVDRVHLTLRNGRSVDARAANGAWLAVIPAPQLTQGVNDEDPGLIVAKAEAYAGDTKRWTYEP